MYIVVIIHERKSLKHGTEMVKCDIPNLIINEKNFLNIIVRLDHGT